jgi:membrane protein involved in colicin uptake
MTGILPKIIAVAALLAALFFVERYIEGRGYDRAFVEARAQVEASKRAAAERLALETQKTRAAEQALQAATATQNTKDAAHAKTINDLSARLRTLSGPAGRLRDPHATGCGTGGGGTESAATATANTGAADGAQAGRLLSGPLTELFLRVAREADDINAAYTSCRADAYTVRASP